MHFRKKRTDRTKAGPKVLKGFLSGVQGWQVVTREVQYDGIHNALYDIRL